jgi:hypothetical protein
MSNLTYINLIRAYFIYLNDLLYSLLVEILAVRLHHARFEDCRSGIRTTAHVKSIVIR